MLFQCFCVPELVLQGRALREACEVLANALAEEAKQRVSSKGRDRDVGRDSPPETNSLPLAGNNCNFHLAAPVACTQRPIANWGMVLQGSM